MTVGKIVLLFDGNDCRGTYMHWHAAYRTRGCGSLNIGVTRLPARLRAWCAIETAEDILDNFCQLLLHHLAGALCDRGNGHEPRVAEAPVVACKHCGDERERGR